MMGCRRCGAVRSLGKLESLPDFANEPSYRAVGTIIGDIESAMVDSNKKVCKTVTKNLSLKAGTIEAHVCTRCGCIDLYVQDPQWVPFSRLDGFSPILFKKDHPMWPNARCPRCNSDRTGRLAELPDTVGKETETRSQALGLDENGILRGNVQALVCTKCGFLQLVVEDPQNLDFEKLEGFSWLVSQRSGPYR